MTDLLEKILETEKIAGISQKTIVSLGLKRPVTTTIDLIDATTSKP